MLTVSSLLRGINSVFSLFLSSPFLSFPPLSSHLSYSLLTSSKLAVRPSGRLKAVLYAVPHILQAGAPFPVVRMTRAVGPHMDE